MGGMGSCMMVKKKKVDKQALHREPKPEWYESGEVGICAGRQKGEKKKGGEDE